MGGPHCTARHTSIALRACNHAAHAARTPASTHPCSTHPCKQEGWWSVSGRAMLTWLQTHHRWWTGVHTQLPPVWCLNRVCRCCEDHTGLCAVAAAVRSALRHCNDGLDRWVGGGAAFPCRLLRKQACSGVPDGIVGARALPHRIRANPSPRGQSKPPP